MPKPAASLPSDLHELLVKVIRDSILYCGSGDRPCEFCAFFEEDNKDDSVCRESMLFAADSMILFQQKIIRQNDYERLEAFSKALLSKHNGASDKFPSTKTEN